MKWVGLIALALLMEGCFFKSYLNDKDNIWVYFEDVDENHDSNISKDEFTKGYIQNDMFKKISSGSPSLTYEEFNKVVAGWKEKSGNKPETETVSSEVSSFDPDGDQKLSKEELAVAMFTLADDNRDNEITALEFYHWEVYL